MKKRTIAIILTMLVIFVAIGLVGCTDKSKNFVTAEETATAIWREVPISNKKKPIALTREPFDLREIITGYTTDFDYQFNTYIFKGTISGLKEYEVSWDDDNGEQLGPYSNAIFEVQVNKEYSGKSPVGNDILKVYYPFSLSSEFSGSACLVEKGEYIFITRVLDDQYVKFAETFSPGFKGETEKHADVCLNEPYYRLLPVDDGKVIMNNGYFCDDDDTMRKALPSDSVNKSKLTSSDLLERGLFIALTTDDFEKAFLELLENPDELSTANR